MKPDKDAISAQENQKTSPPVRKYEKIDLPISVATRSRWLLCQLLAHVGIDAFQERKKVHAIIDRFQFKDMDDATLRLHEVIRHHHQETLSLPREQRPTNEKGEIVMRRHKVQASPMLTDFIYQQTQIDPYTPPIAGCGRFAYVLAKVGEEFGHRLRFATCMPNYLKRDGHMVNFDETDGVYRDASVYKAYYDQATGHWIKGQPYPHMINIPIEELNLVDSPNPNPNFK